MTDEFYQFETLKDLSIAFIYIDNYKGILNDIQLNLGNRYRFFYDKASKHLDFALNEDLIDDYFPPNIKSVTTLVGSNGAGKSTTIKFLLEFLVEGNKGEIKDNDFIILCSEEQLEKFYLYKSSAKNIQFDPSKFKLLNSWNVDFKTSLLFIYSNYLFDPHFYDSNDLLHTEFQGLVNLSTTFLQNKAAEDSFYKSKRFLDENIKKLLIESDYKPGVSSDLLQTFSYTETLRKINIEYQFQEFERQFDFLTEINGNVLTFKTPDYLNFQINMEIFNEDLSLKEKFTDFKKRVGSATNTSYFLINAFGAITIDFILNFNDTFRPLIDYSNIDENIEDLLLHELSILLQTTNNFNLSNFAKKLCSVLADYNSDQVAKYDFTSELNNRYNAVRLLKGIFGKSYEEGEEWCKSVSFKKLRLVKKKQIKDLKRILLNLLLTNRPISIYFSHEQNVPSSLSSGELIILELYSRIHNAKIDRNDQKHNTIVMIFDEIEIGLHPRWQKLYFDYLMNFLNKRFADYNIQLIFTTHSPFLLSDMPSYCVNYFEKKDQIITCSTANENIKPLGQQIHLLYKDSFFIDNGIVGEYAVNKIKELVKKINAEKLIKEDNEKIIKFIENIGDNLLKIGLRQLLEKKTHDKNSAKE